MFPSQVTMRTNTPEDPTISSIDLQCEIQTFIHAAYVKNVTSIHSVNKAKILPSHLHMPFLQTITKFI